VKIGGGKYSQLDARRSQRGTGTNEKNEYGPGSPIAH
jgi:hypothetical protein